MTAEPSSTQIRSRDLITISILRVWNLKTPKGEPITVTLRIEFGDKFLGESPKQECSPEVPAEVNFSANLPCIYDDPDVLDDIVHKPVVVTVVEVLAKEKRQKEEKINILGQCCVGLLPLFQGETEFTKTLLINSVLESPVELTASSNDKPMIEVRISVNEPLLNESQINESNLLTVSVGSLYSPPESWNIMGVQYTYGVALPVPLTRDTEITAFFGNGRLKSAQEKEALNKQKKWAVPGSAQGSAAVLQDRYLFTDPVEDEDGDLTGKDDLDFRRVSELEKNRVTWNMERRCYLQAAGIKNFQEAIAKNRYWPVEISRLTPIAAPKGKKEEDNTSVGFHGVAFLNLTPLLYPGVTRVKGAFKVIGYSEATLFEKTKRKSGISEDFAKLASNSRYPLSPTPRRSVKDVDKKELKKSAQKLDVENASENQLQINAEGQQYTDARSYIMIEICLDKPLIPKRTQEDLVKRVAELIPPRPLYPLRTDRAQKAVDDFHSQVAAVSGTILEEFRNLFNEELQDPDMQTPEAMEERRQQLVYELNSTGKYFAIKEQLKHSVIKIVREKYLRTTDFDDKQELQTFLSELYVYLIDQMHISLGKFLALEDQPPVPKPLTDSNQLKLFAREAEVNHNFTLAATYYKERIARNRNDADCWFDFGTFNLYVSDITKAEECFKECLSINQKHLYGMIMYGVVCMVGDKTEHAETFFEAATYVDSNSILAWTMLGLFYDAVPNEIRAEKAYAEAKRLNMAQALALAEAEKEEAERKEKERKAAEPQPEVASEVEEAESALANEEEIKLSLLQTKPNKSVPAGKTVQISSQPNTAPIITKNNQEPTPPAQEEEPPAEPVPEPAMSIFMQTVNWLLDVKAVSFTERALGHELLTCRDSPSMDFHLSLARLCLQTGDYKEAEDSLNEALQIDFKNPEVWSLMGHVKYLKGDNVSAKHCYERTLSFVTDASETHSVYLRLASIYLQEKKYQDAKNTFVMACKRSPTCVSWLGVGIACYRLGELSEAEDALSEANILNNRDPEVWAYLSLVCLQTNRALQAEQAYKYAMKLNLEEGPLMAEIHNEQVARGFGNPSF